MLLSKAIKQIRFWSGTLDEVTKKAVNSLFSNENIIFQLQYALNDYANRTKAIEDIYSVTLSMNEPYVAVPPLALRSESYQFIMVNIQNRMFPMDMVGQAKLYSAFPYSNIAGIPNWVMPWGHKGQDYLYIMPLKGQTPTSTTLNGAINSTTTTIPVIATTSFIPNNGKFHIDNEVIWYQSTDATNFYGCMRGMEGSTAIDHANGAAVVENNLWLFYRRLHRDIVIYGNNIPETELSTELEIAEEHINDILKYATYNLLLKVDTGRADKYKIDWDAFIEEAEYQIRKGRSQRKSKDIRGTFLFESGLPNWNSVL